MRTQLLSGLDPSNCFGDPLSQSFIHTLKWLDNFAFSYYHTILIGLQWGKLNRELQTVQIFCKDLRGGLVLGGWVHRRIYK